MRDTKELAASIEPSSVPTAALARLPLAMVLSNPGSRTTRSSSPARRSRS